MWVLFTETMESVLPLDVFLCHYTHRTSSLCLPARLTGTVNTRGGY
jgi:hypothetical protein